jgi:hypothetical protein
MRRSSAAARALGTLERFEILDGSAVRKYKGSDATLVGEQWIEGTGKRRECERAERRIVKQVQRDTAPVATVPGPSHAVLHFG